jgi:hypothetical protein
VTSSEVTKPLGRALILALTTFSLYSAADPAPDAQSQARQLLVSVTPAPASTEANLPPRSWKPGRAFDAQEHSRRLLSGAPLREQSTGERSARLHGPLPSEPRDDAQTSARRVIVGNSPGRRASGLQSARIQNN